MGDAEGDSAAGGFWITLIRGRVAAQRSRQDDAMLPGDELYRAVLGSQRVASMSRMIAHRSCIRSHWQVICMQPLACNTVGLSCRSVAQKCQLNHHPLKIQLGQWERSLVPCLVLASFRNIDDLKHY